MRDPHSSDSRGFGFVNFSNGQEADAALVLDGIEFMDRNLIVQKAKRARARTPTPGQYRGPIKERRGIV
jgi:transformer-2 protein